jgi:hypothetical protein
MTAELVVDLEKIPSQYDRDFIVGWVQRHNAVATMVDGHDANLNRLTGLTLADREKTYQLTAVCRWFMNPVQALTITYLLTHTLQVLGVPVDVVKPLVTWLAGLFVSVTTP